MTAVELAHVPNGTAKTAVPGMDPRFAFLLHTPPSHSTHEGAETALPQRHMFEHGNKEHGVVSVHYWPALGVPTNVLLFWPGE